MVLHWVKLLTKVSQYLYHILTSVLRGVTFLYNTSKVILDKRKAIEVAYQRNQQAIYDNANQVCIDLPEPQRSGTITQQKAYLTQVIDKLCAI